MGGCQVSFEVTKPALADEKPDGKPAALADGPCTVTCTIADERLSYGTASTEALGTQLAASEALRLLLQDYDPSLSVMEREEGMKGGSIQQLEAQVGQRVCLLLCGFRSLGRFLSSMGE